MGLTHFKGIVPLRDWHWFLQAAVGFRHIIHTSHAGISYANISQSSKQQAIARLYLHQHYLITVNTNVAIQAIPRLFHILISFVHVGHISMLTNRACHAPLTVNDYRRFRNISPSVSKPDVVSRVSGRNNLTSYFINTYIFITNTTFNPWFCLRYAL